MQTEEIEAMQVKVMENVDNSDSRNQKNPERIKGLEGLKENLGETDLNFNSIVDVSGKRLDFSLINGDERTVEEVYMYKNEFNLIPKTVGMLKGLKTLKFFANEVQLFPGEFRNLVELEYLQVKVTEPGISGLELSKLGNLKELELSRLPPRPSALPILSEIAGLKCLTRLSVCHFSIRYLPPEIGCLTKLEYLDLSFNKMRNLPDEISLLNSLISLRVANNKLAELPLGLSFLQRLENLDLSNNRLTSLDCLDLESMHSLQTLNLQGNSRNLSNDESAEMDVYECVIQETYECPCSPPVATSSHSSGSSSNNRCLAARRAKSWKRRYILQTKARQERLNNCRKWKIDVTSGSSLKKCTTCRVTDNSNDTPSNLSVVVDAEPDNKDIFSEGEATDRCSCPAIDSVRSQSNSVSASISDADVLDEGSSSEASNCVVKSKRHSEKDLDYPKPIKSRRPSNDPSHVSCQYSEMSFCGVGDRLPDGFYDAGRDRPFMPLANYEKNVYVSSREVILLDRERDEELDAILLRAQALIRNFRQTKSSIDEHRDFATDNLQTVSLLSLFVSNHFGGSDKSNVIQRTRKAVSGANCLKPFVCTCATGVNGDTNIANKQNVDTAEDTIFLDIVEKSLRSIKERRNSIIVPIGGLQFGVCRHRALLMKYICDRMEPRIPCELVRGYLDFSPHAWNVIIIKRDESFVRMIVDACHPHDIREENDPEYLCRYIPLTRVSALAADSAGSPNSHFPSLSVCDEIGKLTSTSLMHCSVGSLEAAVKVRTIDICEASADEVRNFEFSCLGEVRMLSVLKHPCIVEYYGHRISSRWSLAPDGTSGGRSLQSAILMEYIKGGSLRGYVEKLFSNGEKHVDVDLALSIARDVAFALTEIHDKHIIHRDLKSDNILIDLEKKSKDGMPIVKICDFDRAVPLHSYVHTCCIAHVGIPSPDICVGTPRWMAPEVFRAMHERNLYGLEVDIWSYGCLLLELLTLQVPYFGLRESEIHNLLLTGERPKLTEELEALIQSDEELETESESLRFLAKLYHRCTEKNPADRPSAQNIYDLLLTRSNSGTGSRTSEQD
ncbi:serine/threonine-protein kinase fray1 [Phtheirospermum japonicum]|uniref:Serine/threonine-protein kinase fray1 n=1 Tax=Phtheirospermum japonicum TaxID=374723 RepID=A0A830BFR3_9LAMI|nr:serine/threonine-protein kinase fray1 [Phtheirospermum japonicum]